MVKALTTKFVKAVKPADKRSEIPDPALKGLYLVVQPSGTKSWALRYRYAGKPKKLTLGKWPVMGVASAREAATDAIEAIETGEDPGAAKRAARSERLQAQLSGRDQIETLFAQYAKRHLSSLKSGAVVQRELQRHVAAPWAGRNIQDIAKRDVIDLLDEIADSGRIVTANRVRAYLNKFLNWCVERDILDSNPANGVKPVAKEISRDRVLSDDEIRWFWQSCEDVGQPWGPLGQLLLLTGQRLGEVVGMTDDEVIDGLWRLPAARTKNSRAHDVPLSNDARAVLASMERVAGPFGYYHSTHGRAPLSGFHKGRNNIAERMIEIASEEAGEAVQIPHWTFHDLRRTAATGMARLGIPVRVTEAVLNHVSGTGGGIVSVYQRHDFADEKRSALDAWANLVRGIVGGQGADNVVRIGGGT